MKKGKIWNRLQLMIIFAMVAALAQNILFTAGNKVNALETYDELCTLLSVTMQIEGEEKAIDGGLEPVYVSANASWEEMVSNLSIVNFEIEENAECRVSYWHDSVTLYFQTEEGWVELYEIFQREPRVHDSNFEVLDDTKPYYDVKIQLFAEKDASTGLYFRIAKEHTHTYGGYSYDADGHWKQCIDADCPDLEGSKIEEGTHTGGTATCTDKAVCEICQQAYGEETSHSYKEQVTPATKKKNGKLQLVCQECGDVSATTVIYKIDKVKLSGTAFVFDGTVKKPGVTITDSKGNKLVAGTDYKVSYAKGRKAVGKYNVVVTFKGNYSGTITKTFTIKPKATSIKSVTAGKKQFTVVWKKLTKQTTGYQIQYATTKDFKEPQAVLVKNNTKNQKIIKKLSARTKYFVRIRTYKTVEVNGKQVKIFSAWSKVEKVKTK